jgi:hypothetical protein
MFMRRSLPDDALLGQSASRAVADAQLRAQVTLPGGKGEVGQANLHQTGARVQEIWSMVT